MSVSVIMTCHNEERFIEQAVRSVQAQTAYDKVAEILVVDDGSTDGSRALLESLRVEIPKLEIIPATGVGLPAARNLALARSRGELIAILDGDDFWVPEKLERQLPAFALSSEVGLVYSDFCDFTQDDMSDAQLIPVRVYHVSHNLPLAEYFVHDAPIIPSTIIVRREVFDTVGPFDAEMRLGEDTEMFLRIAERWHFEHVPSGLTFKRRHGGNLTASLERLVPVGEVQAKRVVERNPSMKPLAAKFLSRRYASAGNDCVKQGRRRDGIRYLRKALAKNPFAWRIYAYLAVAVMPGWLESAARRSFWALKRLFRRDGRQAMPRGEMERNEVASSPPNKTARRRC
jgi:glycosyltransferase involved in cell wall biosynthesis